MVHFLSWPGVTCSPSCPQTLPQTFFNPPAFAHHASSWVFYLPLEMTLEGTRVLMQEFLSFFFSRSFLILPGAWEGRSAPGPRQVSCSVDAPKPLERLCCTVPLNLFVDCPACPRGLLTASDLSLSLTQGPAPPPASNPRGSRIPGETGLCTSVQQVTRTALSGPADGVVKTSNKQDSPAFHSPGASKLIF